MPAMPKHDRMERFTIISVHGDEERIESEGRNLSGESNFISNITPGDAFATRILPIRLLYRLSLFLSYHWWWCLDSFIALFIDTTEEKIDLSRLPKSVQKLLIFLKGFFLASSLLILCPCAILSAVIWLPLQFVRPRSFSFYCATESSNEKQHLLFSDVTAYQNIGEERVHFSSRAAKGLKTNFKKPYVLVSGNVCLMPEFLARLNNVRDSVKRAEKISQLVCGIQLPSDSHKTQPYINQSTKGLKPLDTEILVKTASEISINAGSVCSKFENESFYDEEVISIDSTVESRSISSVQCSITSKERAISESFPKSTDFLCLQEIFDRRAATVLLKGLQTKYPYILYDVMWPLHHGKINLINSGLCIASKYPFIDVQFRAFPDGFREDKLACKGLLMTKVYLGETEDNKSLVGYLATTHLQAITHDKASEVRCKQLNLLLKWLNDFKKSTSNNRHTVVFDIICGDFNFDQESHFEENERKCQFRNEYRDPCMNEVTGVQHSWVIGTELIAEFLHENAVSCSKGLQRMLISELERPRYVASTAPKGAVGQTSDGRRRVDYILYKPCDNKKMLVRDYKFITGFATLTDHIPLSMTFSVEE